MHHKSLKMTTAVYNLIRITAIDTRTA